MPSVMDTGQCTLYSARANCELTLVLSASLSLSLFLSSSLPVYVAPARSVSAPLSFYATKENNFIKWLCSCPRSKCTDTISYIPGLLAVLTHPVSSHAHLTYLRRPLQPPLSIQLTLLQSAHYRLKCCQSRDFVCFVLIWLSIEFRIWISESRQRPLASSSLALSLTQLPRLSVYDEFALIGKMQTLYIKN